MYLKRLLMVLVVAMCTGCNFGYQRSNIIHEVDSVLLNCDTNTMISSRNDEGNKRSLVITCTVTK